MVASRNGHVLIVDLLLKDGRSVLNQQDLVKVDFLLILSWNSFIVLFYLEWKVSSLFGLFLRLC
jgi:hypothetical protein